MRAGGKKPSKSVSIDDASRLFRVRVQVQARFEAWQKGEKPPFQKLIGLAGYLDWCARAHSGAARAIPSAQAMVVDLQRGRVRWRWGGWPHRHDDNGYVVLALSIHLSFGAPSVASTEAVTTRLATSRRVGWCEMNDAVSRRMSSFSPPPGILVRMANDAHADLTGLSSGRNRRMSRSAAVPSLRRRHMPSPGLSAALNRRSATIGYCPLYASHSISGLFFLEPFQPPPPLDTRSLVPTS